MNKVAALLPSFQFFGLQKVWTHLYPPAPTFTEKVIPSQTNRVFIVTGGASGIGYELSLLLYHSGAKVYIVGRNEENAHKAIDLIKATPNPTRHAPGELKFLYLDLSDLSTTKKSAQEFLAKEQRLDVLFNNAGVANLPAHLRSPQDYEMHTATNILGPFLFTQLLLPLLRSTALTAPKGSVRVIWTSSIIVESKAPQEVSL